VKIKQLLSRLDKKIKLPKIQNKIVPHEKIITDDELDILMNNCTPLLKSFIWFLHSTGMRIGEVCNIKLSDCKTELFTVYIKTMGKGEKERTVSCPLEVFNYVKNHFNGSVYLFEHSGKQYDKRYITTRLSVVGKRYLNKRFHAHMLRHSYISKLVDGGLQPTIIAEMVGHSSTAITALYTHLTANIDQVKEAMNFKDYSGVDND